MYFPQLQASDTFASLSRLEVEKKFLGRDHDFQDLTDELLRPEEWARLRLIAKYFSDTELTALGGDYNWASEALRPTPVADDDSSDTIKS